MRTEGVQLAHVLRGPERMGLYFAEPGADVANARIVYDRAGSAFASIAPALLDWPVILADADWLHLTGITAALGDGPVATLAAGIAAARARGIPVSLDLNYRPALWRDRNPVPVLAPLVRGVDLLIANPHSARAMLGLDVADDALATPAGALALSRRIADSCACERVALTRREILGTAANRWSATLYHAGTGAICSSRPWTVTVIDRIGGGDSFAASLIAAMLRNRPADDALEFAVAASALKLRVPGDFNRVKSADVDKMLRAMDAAGARSGELRT
jgi:2-dehydro-3-deoxygluconokinase